MENYITLAHGAGGRQTATLIREIFAKNFSNPYLTSDDAAILPTTGENIAFTTDGFIVSPWEFPGGNIGKLSICGTVNDLACMGARPRYLTCAAIIEEGFPISALEKIASSMGKTAREAGIQIVAGDTKVAGKGQVDRIFITTTGIGELLPEVHPNGAGAKPGDAVIVTGDIGRHGCAILLARDEFSIHADVESDCAPLWALVEQAFRNAQDIHVIRDATRGGVGTVLHEVAEQSGVGIRLKESAIPVDPAVKGVCGMLGLEPLYLACEGRLVMFVPQEAASRLLTVLKNHKDARGAALIGEVKAENKGRVTIMTDLGTEILLPPPGGELLPRIC